MNKKLISLLNISRDEVYLSYRVMNGEIELKDVSNFGDYTMSQISDVIEKITELERRLSWETKIQLFMKPICNISDRIEWNVALLGLFFVIVITFIIGSILIHNHIPLIFSYLDKYLSSS